MAQLLSLLSPVQPVLKHVEEEGGGGGVRAWGRHFKGTVSKDFKMRIYMP
jgi:hypothetical protein